MVGAAAATPPPQLRRAEEEKEEEVVVEEGEVEKVKVKGQGAVFSQRLTSPPRPPGGAGHRARGAKVDALGGRASGSRVIPT